MAGGKGGEGREGIGRTWQFTVESGKLLSERLDARPVPPILSVFFRSELSQLVWAGMLREEAPVSPTLPCPLAGYRFSFFIGAQKPELTPCPFTLQRSMPRCLQHTVSLSFSFWPPPQPPPPPLSLTACGKKTLCSATVHWPCPCEAVCCPVMRRRREPSSKNKPSSFQFR